MRKQDTKWKKIFTKDTSDKGLLSKYTKNFYKWTTQFKIGQNCEQTYNQRRYTDNKQVYAELLSIICH